jgi:hypothetical protein
MTSISNTTTNISARYLRFEIHDELGCLRKFATKEEALRFKSEDTTLVIKPRYKGKSKKQVVLDFINTIGEALV